MYNPNVGSPFVVVDTQVLDTECLSHHTFRTRDFQGPGKGHARDLTTSTTCGCDGGVDGGDEYRVDEERWNRFVITGPT
jgi:hypothetical protein